MHIGLILIIDVSSVGLVPLLLFFLGLHFSQYWENVELGVELLHNQERVEHHRLLRSLVRGARVDYYFGCVVHSKLCIFGAEEELVDVAVAGSEQGSFLHKNHWVFLKGRFVEVGRVDSVDCNSQSVACDAALFEHNILFDYVAGQILQIPVYFGAVDQNVDESRLFIVLKHFGKVLWWSRYLSVRILHTVFACFAVAWSLVIWAYCAWIKIGVLQHFGTVLSFSKIWNNVEKL